MQKRLSKAVLALDSSIPTIAAVSAAYGPDTAHEWLLIQMNDLFEYTEQPPGVTVERIDEAVDLMIHSYPYINLFEFMLFFAECKLTRYGSFYGVTGPSRLNSMFLQFLAEREQSIISYHEEQQRRRNDLKPAPQNGLAEYLDIKQRAANGDLEAKRILKQWSDEANITK